MYTANCKLVGMASLIDVRRNIRTWTINRAELSYWIGISYTGKGFATEASKAIVEFGFNNLSLNIKNHCSCRKEYRIKKDLRETKF
jgi:RimJ/RimL family protein N-acetyltransferase